MAESSRCKKCIENTGNFHACPFQVEIFEDDDENYCDCCDDCTDQCADNI